MLIIDQLQSIAVEMCEHYCKYPEQYKAIYSDPDEAWFKMRHDKCFGCPLLKL